MTVQDLENLFHYGYWANRKLLAVMSQLTPEQFTRTVDGTHDSLRNTMVHVLSAEWSGLSHCGSSERGAPLNSIDYPTVARLAETRTQVEGYVRAFLSTLRDEDLVRNKDIRACAQTPNG